jgi:hypothetical protein
MKAKIAKYIGLIASLLFTIACSEVNKETSTNTQDVHYKKETVEAVFYHNVNNYSVMVRDGNSLKPVSFPRTGALEVHLFDDVKAGEDMWYEVSYVKSERDYMLNAKEHPGYLNIHIRGLEDLNGAGWNYGKIGNGMTIKIASK